MPATRRHFYAPKDNDAEPFLLRIDASYSHGENNMAGMMDEHHVVGSCPACGVANSLQFYEDDDASPFVLSVDARGTYFCHSCEESFIDEQFYKDTPALEYTFPFDGRTAGMLVARFECCIGNHRVASGEFNLERLQKVQEVIDSLCSYLIACFNYANNKGAVTMLLHLVEQFGEGNIADDMFLSSLRVLLLPEDYSASSTNLPDNLVS